MQDLQTISNFFVVENLKKEKKLVDLKFSFIHNSYFIVCLSEMILCCFLLLAQCLILLLKMWGKKVVFDLVCSVLIDCFVIYGYYLLK